MDEMSQCFKIPISKTDFYVDEHNTELLVVFIYLPCLSYGIPNTITKVTDFSKYDVYVCKW